MSKLVSKLSCVACAMQVGHDFKFSFQGRKQFFLVLNDQHIILFINSHFINPNIIKAMDETFNFQSKTTYFTFKQPKYHSFHEFTFSSTKSILKA